MLAWLDVYRYIIQLAWLDVYRCITMLTWFEVYSRTPLKRADIGTHLSGLN